MPVPAAAVFFALADGIGWLLVARALQGLAVGAASGAFTAALLATEPTRNRHRASLAVTAMTAAGGGLGPILCGLFADYLPAPLTLIFWIETVLLIVSALVIRRTPATLGTTGRQWRPTWPAVPAHLKRSFAAASSVSLVAWAVTALFLALAPSYVEAFTGSRNILLAGFVAGLILVCSGISQLASQLVFSSLSAQKSQLIGLTLLAVGLIGLPIAAATHTAAIVLTGGVAYW
ncbi:MFS transporter [Paeniglutamicibacter antarcticus]|uniref:MFS transporter n=1 Tax=Arthrobacter terrae TaxID=2935737 RepID=A0A931CUF9_9MICC|nr:MFS transporter [Arthrobacter terrae]MBG0741136.1 MFS transporter [Arthrobacter terrae]